MNSDPCTKKINHKFPISTNIDAKQDISSYYSDTNIITNTQDTDANIVHSFVSPRDVLLCWEMSSHVQF